MVSFPTPTILWFSGSRLGIWEFNSILTVTPGISPDPTSEGFSPTGLPSLQTADINEVSRPPTVLSSNYKFRDFHDSPSGLIICYNTSQNSGKYFLTITAFLLLQRIHSRTAWWKRWVGQNKVMREEELPCPLQLHVRMPVSLEPFCQVWYQTFEFPSIW